MSEKKRVNDKLREARLRARRREGGLTTRAERNEARNRNRAVFDPNYQGFSSPAPKGQPTAPKAVPLTPEQRAELAFEAMREPPDKINMDPLGIMTPERYRDRYYNQSGRTIGGDRIPSQRTNERIAFEETYDNDNEFQREIDEVSDFDEIDHPPAPIMPTRAPPKRPTRVTMSQTMPNMPSNSTLTRGMPSQSTSMQLRTPERNADVALIQRKESVNPFDRNNFVGGTNFYDPSMRSADSSVPNVYNDSLAPESAISQSAYDRELYNGVEAYGRTPSDFRDIDRMRRDEIRDDASRGVDMVNEHQILSGGRNNSLFNGSDIGVPDNEERKHDDEDEERRGYSISGVDRGNRASSITDLDLESAQAFVDRVFDEDNNRLFNDDVSSIGRNFGDSIPQYRDYDDDNRSIMSGADSIMSSISNIADLSSQDGSWFSKDKDLDKDVDVNDRMSGGNKIAMNKDMRNSIGKYNPNVLAGNKLLMSQKASLGTIGELRKKDVNWKQPNRSFKNTQVDLIRLGNKTQIELSQQFDP